MSIANLNSPGVYLNSTLRLSLRVLKVVRQMQKRPKTISFSKFTRFDFFFNNVLFVSNDGEILKKK
jgi:hypothetical protein